MIFMHAMRVVCLMDIFLVTLREQIELSIWPVSHSSLGSSCPSLSHRCFGVSSAQPYVCSQQPWILPMLSFKLELGLNDPSQRQIFAKSSDSQMHLSSNLLLYAPLSSGTTSNLRHPIF